MGSRLERSLAVLGVSAAVACGALVEPSGTTPEGDGGTAPDGSVPVADAAPLPAEAAVPGCSGHTFCADFEDGTALHGFDKAVVSVDAGSGGGWSLASDPVVSPTHALHTLVHPGEQAYLDKTLGTNLTHVTVELSIFIGSWGWTGGGKSHPLTIRCNGSIAFIKIGQDHFYLTTNTVGDTPFGDAFVPHDRWRRFRLDFAIGATSGKATLVDVTGGSVGASVTLDTGGCSGDLKIDVGDDPADNNGTYELYIDDVTADWQ